MRQKNSFKILSTWVLCVSLPFFLLSQEVEEETAPTPVRVEVKEKHFSMEIPSNWVRDKVPEGVDFFAAAPLGEENTGVANLSVIAGKVGRKTQLEDFFKANVKNLENVMKEFKEISRGTGGVPNQQTDWIVFSHKVSGNNGDLELYELQYYLIVGEYGYVVTFSATPNEYVALRGRFEEIISSFEASEEPTLPSIQLAPAKKGERALPPPENR